ncbi:hypothetical protein J2I47_02840 [Fibrella sp. HMF5335]|uniref:Lipoprotein n=1 Tax=Fibrella rubiginis TaxID=2817060 RepID=A0A939GBU0_9BACT|nr:hypothetical protein [Fibrella rubiginis]MBO0935476.1 hypothetical protein [Fibrella rubiginis]
MRLRTTSLIAVTTIIFLFGCKKSDSVAAVDSCQLAGTRAQAYSDAIVAYSKAQTPANCTAVKTTANAYLDAAAGCTTVTQAQITAARASVNDLKC